jgi:glycosyltransferase involved in cell wall biosynthesis
VNVAAQPRESPERRARNGPDRVMRVRLITTAATIGGVSRHMDELANGLPALGCEISSEEERADIVHIHLHDTYDRKAFALAVAARARGAKVILTEHLPRTNASDESLLPGPRRRGAPTAKRVFKRAQARAAHRIITVCEASKAFLDVRYGIRGATVRTIVNGVAVPPTFDAALPNGQLRVLSTGALIAQKGHEVLLDAAARSRCEWTAVIIGEGSGRGALERRSRALGDGRVSLLGWRDDAVNASLDADVFCLPSRWETSPYVVLDAMAHARCVVASKIDGLPAMVEHGVSGLLVEPDDPAALAQALDHLAANPQEVRRMGVAARTRVEQRFEVTQMVAATHALYREVVGR